MSITHTTIETDEKITMTVNTGSYFESVSVSIKAFMLAEKMNHHPTVTTGYNQVKIEVNTHDAGNIVTALDKDYIRQLSALL